MVRYDHTTLAIRSFHRDVPALLPTPYPTIAGEHVHDFAAAHLGQVGRQCLLRCPFLPCGPFCDAAARSEA
jgi:hypothetical protein